MIDEPTNDEPTPTQRYARLLGELTSIEHARLLGELTSIERERLVTEVFATLPPRARRRLGPSPLDVEIKTEEIHYAGEDGYRQVITGISSPGASFEFRIPSAENLIRWNTAGWASRDSSEPDRLATPPPPPHAPTAGERRLAEQLEAAGWVDVAVTPPRDHAYRDESGGPIPGAVEVVGFDGPDADWAIRVDGGDDGVAEGYTVTRLDDDAESPRVPGPRVPTPNEAVGAWERQQRVALEAARPRGRKG